MTKPTPEEKCNCLDCMNNPHLKPTHSPEANEPERGYCDGDTWHLQKPSPEARVDWEQRAEELLENIMNFPLSYGLKEFVAGELKAAYEAGVKSNG
jgi:hypothetical protein